MGELGPQGSPKGPPGAPGPGGQSALEVVIVTPVSTVRVEAAGAGDAPFIAIVVGALAIFLLQLQLPPRALGVEQGCCVSRHAICKRDGMVHPVDVDFAAKWLRADEMAEHPASVLLGTRLARLAHSNNCLSCPPYALSGS